jgi:glycosyltransferase involved in cell wall biosynthesis
MSDLSILIRTRNCRAVLRECLAALARQSLRDVELVVLDSESTDGTAGEARAAGARVVEAPVNAFTYGGALNRGFQGTTGRFLCSLSAHAILMEPTVLERLAAVLRAADDRVAGVYGCPVFTDEQALSLSPELPVRRIVKADFERLCNLGLSNSFSIVRRSCWEAFPFPIERCEDQKWAAHHLALGGATLCVLSARYRYRLNQTFPYYVRKHRDDFLMLNRSWPECPWPRGELFDAARNRYRLWCMLRRFREAGWTWNRLTDAQKWFATSELGLFWAGAMVRGGRAWPFLFAADLARVVLFPSKLKGWVMPSEEWP